MKLYISRVVAKPDIWLHGNFLRSVMVHFFSDVLVAGLLNPKCMHAAGVAGVDARVAGGDVGGARPERGSHRGSCPGSHGAAACLLHRQPPARREPNLHLTPCLVFWFFSRLSCSQLHATATEIFLPAPAPVDTALCPQAHCGSALHDQRQ